MQRNMVETETIGKDEEWDKIVMIRGLSIFKGRQEESKWRGHPVELYKVRARIEA